MSSDPRRIARLRDRFQHRVTVADGGLGTSLQNQHLTPDDFGGKDGCNEYLNLTCPDAVRRVHASFLDVGCDAVEANTFGANPSNLGEYGLDGRLAEIALAGARLAREVADSYDRERYVFGSMGPGTKLPSLGNISFRTLRDGYEAQAAALIEGGVDLLMVETVQDILQAKAAVIGAKRARAAAGIDVPIVVSVTVETTGTLLLGTETMAAFYALAALGIDGMGLNCATGPDTMGEHLRQLAGRLPVTSAMPNAGLPELGPDGPRYPLTPAQLAAAAESFVGELGLGLVGGCCGTTPAHLRAVVQAVGDRELSPRNGSDAGPRPMADPSPSVPGPVSDGNRRAAAGVVSSLYHDVPLSQDVSYLAVGERANAQGSRAFREAIAAGDLDRVAEIARDQVQSGAHVIDLSVDAVGRDGVADMAAVAARLATDVTAPIMIDSTEPPVIESALEHLGGRCLVNSVNFEDGGERLERVAAMALEHGAAIVALTIDEAGQARTAERKVEVAERLIARLTELGFDEHDIVLDPLTFPVATGAAETRRDGLETLTALARLRAAHPAVHLMLGVSNISFGLAPAARRVLNSVFLAEAVAAGLDAAIVNPARIAPLDSLDPDARSAAEDLLHDRQDRSPLARLLQVGQDPAAASAADPLEGLAPADRLTRRVVTGRAAGLETDIDAALVDHAPLELVNAYLLPGMAEVGDAFGAGRTQLPFVLQSAEVMKAAVALLEPHIAAAGGGAMEPKGTFLIATVRGDVHDIGKNLVGIICSNNGYKVVDIGTKQPISQILKAAEDCHADVIGMSGLLVKSTQVMRENLQEMNRLGLLYPVILGGAALTRTFVEDDLAPEYLGEVHYAKDAFETLHLLDEIRARGDRPQATPADAPRAEATPAEATPAEVTPAPASSTPSPSVEANGSFPSRNLPSASTQQVEEPSASTLAKGASASGASGQRAQPAQPSRSAIRAVDAPPVPPFWGSRLVSGLRLDDVLACLDERVLMAGRWGLRPPAGDPRSQAQYLAEEGKPRLDALIERVRASKLPALAVAYGYFHAHASGDAIEIEGPDSRTHRLDFPRQATGRRLCLADYFRTDDDVIAVQVVTAGPRFTPAAAALKDAGRYRDYLELAGLGAQLAEALAEYWHGRVRAELGLAEGQGERYSFGYPACPDLAGRRVLTDLVGADRIGVTLSETDQLDPEYSTDAIVVHHPGATLFSVRSGRAGKGGR